MIGASSLKEIFSIGSGCGGSKDTFGVSPCGLNRIFQETGGLHDDCSMVVSAESIQICCRGF